MEIEKLVFELKSQWPDLGLIKTILNQNKDLVNGLLQDNASALHFAARNDTLYGNHLTEILLNEFCANPNNQNSAGSIPLF